MRNPMSHHQLFYYERCFHAGHPRAAKPPAAKIDARKIDARKLPLLASLALALIALPGRAAANTQPVLPRQVSTPAAAGPDAAHVWTNADIARLATENNISLVGPEPVTSSNPPAPPVAPSYSEKKARWIGERAEKLHRELHRRKEKLSRYLHAIDEAKNRENTESGVNLYEGNVGITLDSGREILESSVHEVEAKLDDLADLARRNDIAPGALRTDPSLPD